MIGLRERIRAALDPVLLVAQRVAGSDKIADATSYKTFYDKAIDELEALMEDEVAKARQDERDEAKRIRMHGRTTA